MQRIFDSVRNQYRAFFKPMAFDGMAWHLYRQPGTDRFLVMRSDAVQDVPLEIAVFNIHCMTEGRVLQAVQNLIRG